jgi:hypothetical protein
LFTSGDRSCSSPMLVDWLSRAVEAAHSAAPACRSTAPASTSGRTWSGPRCAESFLPCTKEALLMRSNPDIERPHSLDGERRHQMVAPSLGPSALRWWRAFSGEARELGRAREWLVSLLPECPARDDVISVATELGSNALLHTASGRDGVFAVEITCSPSIVPIAVADCGGPAEPRIIEEADGEYGRGLLLVLQQRAVMASGVAA